MFGKIRLLFHTVRHLRPVQLIGRVKMLAPRLIKETRQRPALQAPLSEAVFIPKPPGTSDFDAFTFLNATHRLSEAGWDNPAIPLLWRYNLHYFDFINALDAGNPKAVAASSALIDRWVAGNPFGKGTGWAPYPTSLRIINWVKWHWRTGGLSETALISLWNQVRWLADRPEYHLLGNHLFINAKALLFAAAFFEGKEVGAILDKAMIILDQELDEQFMPDGAHFELSPMYHALGMEDLLDLMALADHLDGRLPVQQLGKKVRSGLVWLKALSYENGELARFNDCADGIAPTLKELLAHSACNTPASELNDGNGITVFSDSGFVVARNPQFTVIADVGRIGPDYLPGHAHADTLSFELAVSGKRLVVNSGTGVYGVSAERLRQRGTAAHSTVTIDNENSSEVWSGFRVARRAYPKDLGLPQGDGPDFEFSCSHDGYVRLPGSPIHTRKWRGSADSLTLEDAVSGGFSEATVRFHFHPDINLQAEGAGLNAIHQDGTPLASVAVQSADGSPLPFQLVRSSYFPQFGKALETVCLEIRIPRDGRISTCFRFYSEK